MAKRILGGIAWACALLLVTLMTRFASSQDGSDEPFIPQPAFQPSLSCPPSVQPAHQVSISQPGIPTRQPLSFQQGLSSKEYLRLMAEAYESGKPTIPKTSIAAMPATALDCAPQVQLATAMSSNPATSVQSVVQNDIGIPIEDAQTMNNRFAITYENVWLRRSGDEGMSWSSGVTLGPIGEDRATSIRLGWHRNPMERYEFAYLGSLVWHRRLNDSHPNDSMLTPSESEPGWLGSFQNSFEHDQTHTARLRSYEFNKRWITDDLGNYFLGLHMVDYEEVYGLRTLDSDGSGWLGLSTNNLLAGLQGGLELWHPLSQRLAVGGQGILGLYGNFAEGGWDVDIEDGGSFQREDRRFQTAAGFGLNAKGRYQFTSRLYAFGSYRWWYLAGMATANDQTIGPLDTTTPFALSTDAGFLIHGASCGLEFVF